MTMMPFQHSTHAPGEHLKTYGSRFMWRYSSLLGGVDVFLNLSARIGVKSLTGRADVIWESANRTFVPQTDCRVGTGGCGSGGLMRRPFKSLSSHQPERENRRLGV